MSDRPDDIQRFDDAATAALIAAADRRGATREILAGLSPAEQRKVMAAHDRDVNRRRS